MFANYLLLENVLNSFKLILEVQLGAPLIGILSPFSLFKFHDATFDRS